MFDNSVAVIPARYGSTRFPGKVLAEICGKPMIQWVYERTAESIADEVMVATDDERVVKAVEGFGGKAVMTSPDHPSGTDRIYEAIQHTDKDIIINVQGDEPLIPTEVIDDLVKAMTVNQNITMATVAVKAPRKEMEDPNKVKVVLDNNDFALYFSRSMIPYLREGADDTPVFLHWGIYAYRRATLNKLVSLPQGKLEACEKLEQLRALENGVSIYVMRSGLSSIGVDTPEDLAQAELKMREQGLC
ncbi:MAG: 3-deoxy-manno-octulosonate cytidylyltransferase [Lentisphaerae bacterium]|nr:3-deoxy-manno-octulosonate cytidylyltransferase [Lentisphaerota bacterium]MCP4102295.1 3-deoxy-manno-octulosonate cytidylyltransferase [Lentisphaerota bacterium]